jgi:hypothetical protein
VTSNASGPLAGSLGFLFRQLSLYRVVDFFSMDRNISWCVDPNTDFIASDVDNSDPDVVADHDRLIALS